MINFIIFFLNLFGHAIDFNESLNRMNYEDLVESLKINLAITNLDLAVRKEEPVINVDFIVEQKIQHEKWAHLNKVCLMAMKYHLA